MAKGMSLNDAYELVLSKKPNVAPNKSFWSQLIRREQELFHRDTPSLCEEEYLARQIKAMLQSDFSIPDIMEVLKSNSNDVDSAVATLLER
jgi:hypothetical protein